MKVWLQLISSQEAFVYFFEVFHWIVVGEKFWSFQNLSLTIPDGFRKNFDYRKDEESILLLLVFS